MFAPYKFPDHLNPDYLRGYEDGFDAMKHEISRFMQVVKALKTETSTVSSEVEDGKTT